jgi:hypothetical protein
MELLPDDILNIIYGMLPKTYQCMLSMTNKNLRAYRRIKLKSNDVANDGDLKFLKQCKKITTYTWKLAIKNGHIHILDWLYDNHPIKLDDYYCYYAVKYNNSNGLKWLISHSFDYRYHTVCKIIKKENFEMINLLSKTLYDRWNIDIIICQFGKINMLDWVKEKNLIKENNIILCATLAAENGHANIIKWFRNNGIEVNDENIIHNGVALAGQLNILKYYTELKYNIRYETFEMLVCNCNNYKHILEWARHNGYKDYVDRVCDRFGILN